MGIIVVVVIGLIAGLILSFASIIFAVPVDEKAEAIQGVLPGANCGACGFPGCSGYAAALAAGEAEVGLCSPGGADVAAECAEILGVAAGSMEKKVAIIQCAGTCSVVDKKMNYEGIESCAAAAVFFGGDSACQYGCLGHGDCASVCPENAITICNGLATVNTELCVGCGLCAKACPKNVIIIEAEKWNQHVRCKNTDKGAETRKTCKVGCIGCMKCQKECEAGAITVTNFNATIDYSKCTNCGHCKDVCPVKAIQ